MKLLVTFSIFLSSLFVREPVFVNAGTSNWKATSVNSHSDNREKAIAAMQMETGFDEITLFDDEDDDDKEFNAGRKKIQLLRSLNNSTKLLLIRKSHEPVFDPGFGNYTYFLPGAERCIFQRVIRV